MEASGELHDLIKACCGLFESGDLQRARQILSRDERLLIAGTDPQEFAQGPDAVLHLIEEQALVCAPSLYAARTGVVIGGTGRPHRTLVRTRADARREGG